MIVKIAFKGCLLLVLVVIVFLLLSEGLHWLLVDAGGQ
jgi:hypothetical protein